MANDKILIKYAMKNDKKAEILHSSVYAQAQSGEKIGSASTGIDMAKRAALDNQRKFVKGYRDSSLMQGVKGTEHAKKFVPRVNQEAEGEQARIGRGDDAVRTAHAGGGLNQEIAIGGERNATGMREGTPRGQQAVARGGERNR